MSAIELKEGLQRFLNGRSSIVGSIALMFVTSFLVSLVLAWIPIVGPFLGPVAGGFLGGRRAGSVGRALAAAVLPALVASILIFVIGVGAAAITSVPVIGAVAAIMAGAVWVFLIVHNIVLFGAAAIGGYTASAPTTEEA